MLINRQDILRVWMNGLGRESESIVHPIQPGFDSTLQQLPYDPKAAKQMLAEEGWVDSNGDGILDKVIGRSRVPFQVTFVITPSQRELYLLITESLNKAGIQTNVIQRDYLAAGEYIKRRAFDAIILGWSGDPIEPDLYQWFHSKSIKNGRNFSSYENTQADSLLDAIRSQWDRHERHRLFARLQQLLAEDQPITVLPEQFGGIAVVDKFDNVILKSTFPPLDPRYLRNKRNIGSL